MLNCPVPELQVNCSRCPLYSTKTGCSVQYGIMEDRKASVPHFFNLGFNLPQIMREIEEEG